MKPRGRLLLVPVPIASATPVHAADVERVLPAATLAALRGLTYFLVENARHARAVLKAAGHPVALADLRIVQIGHAPPAERVEEWLRPLVAEGIDAGVLSEAGCPGIADPGAELVARAHDLELEVVPLVGPSAPTLALMASGLNGQRFRFVGYLPRPADACTAAIRRLEADSARLGETQLAIETPYRAPRLFEALLAACRPETLLCVAGDLTGARQFVATRSIARWRAAASRPRLDDTPCVFALLAPLPAARADPPALIPSGAAPGSRRPGATRSGRRTRRR